MAKLKPIQGRAPEQDYFEFTGGLDRVTPAMKMPPGRLLESMNWDIPAEGGYRRIPGFERYDGRTRPSDASAVVLGAATTYSGLVVGDAVNGQTSGATGTVCYVAADGTYIAVTKVTGAFTLGENIREGATVRGVYAIPPTYSADIGNQIAEAASDQYRSDIAAPTGSGQIRGGFSYGGVRYVFRNNAGGTAVDVWKNSTSGWTQIALAEEVYFTGANASVGVGDTLTQGAVTATVRRVIITSGSAGAGTAVGKLVISGRAGGNYAAGAATSTGGGALTLTGAQAAQTFPAGGKYRFRNHNFGGATASRYMYGCNGVGRAFEFDGTYFAFIDTGSTGPSGDKPEFIAVFKNHLFIAIDHSLQHSAPGEPHIWSVVYGAAELAVGGDVTTFLESTESLQVQTKEYTKALVGTGVGNWDFRMVAPDVGGAEDTAQLLAKPVFLDKVGVSSLRPSQVYGNFEGDELSKLIKPYITPLISSAVCSVVSHRDGQYRLLFSDGSGIAMTFQGPTLIGCMPFTLGVIPSCAWEDDESGDVYFGATNGMVYEMGRGRSLDGAVIDHRLRLAWNFTRSPLLRKKYRRVTFDVFANGYADVNISFQVSRNDSEVDTGTIGLNADFGSGGVAAWDDPDTAWDEAAWDGDGFTRFGVPLEVSGTDISFSLTGSSDNQLAFTISGLILIYSKLRVDRRYE